MLPEEQQQVLAALADIRARAFSEGYTRGYQDGWAKGYEAGKRDSIPIETASKDLRQQLLAMR